MRRADFLIMQSRNRDAAFLFAAVDSALDEILSLVKRHADHDFSSYKRATLIRRTLRRMQKERAETAVGYLERLRRDPSEAKVLFQELLVGVTGFFRDPDVFAYLAVHVLPGLAESEPSTSRRVWVAGCSTGEEAYTIAMLCDELGDRLPALRRMQLFATDVDPVALKAARLGRFPASRTADLTPERLERFFDRAGRDIQVKRWLRDRIVFARHDLLADVPYSRLDLICCRNVLIYFGQREPDRLLSGFHRSLRQHGKLLLGTSESVRGANNLFSALDVRHRLYQRLDGESTSAVQFPSYRSRPMTAAHDDADPLEFASAHGESSKNGQHADAAGGADGSPDIPRDRSPQAGAGHVARLERELREVRAELLRVTRDADSVSDELKSTIEELSSMNEEMQAAIEELDRSKGELEHVNDALAESNRELANLLDSTGIPTIFLDGAGAIRRTNPHVGRIYNLRSDDVGRPLEHFTHRAVQMPPLPSLDEVHAAESAIEHEVDLHDGATYLRRIRAYANAEAQESGLSITFTDVTERVRFQREIRASEWRLRNVIHATLAFIGLMAPDGTLLEANQAPLQAAGLTREDTIGRKMWDCAWFTHAESVRERLRDAFARATRGELVRYDEEIRVANDARITIDFMLQPVFQDGVLQFFVPSAVDVTHRIVAEQHLVAQHALVRAITDNASTAIFVLDRDGRCTFANPASMGVTGLAHDQLIGMLLHDRLHPEESATLTSCPGSTCALRLALTGATSVREMEATVVREDLGTLSVAVSAGAIDGEGATVRTVVEIRDVTESLRAQRELRLSETRFRQMAEAIGQMAWIADPNGDIFWYNQRWYDYTGSSLSDVQGWGWKRFHDPVMLPAVMERWQTSIAAGTAFEMVVPLLGKDGQFHPFLTQINPLRGEHGEIQMWFGTNTDLSAERAHSEELRQNERRLQAITDAVPDVLIRFDRSYRHTFANPAAERVLGLSLPHVIGKTTRDVGLPLAVCDQIETAIQEVFASAKRQSLDCVMPTPDGVRKFAVLLTPELGDDGSVDHVLSLARDQTAELDATEALREANRRKDQFLATLAHELRNPLAPLRNGLEILRLVAGDDEQVTATRAIMERQVANMTRLVDDLLDVSRISLGKVALRTAPVDAREVITEALELTQHAVQQQRLTVKTVLPAEAVVVKADRIRLGQVLGNLISNAVKYTPANGALCVSLERIGIEVCISITDSGRGIAADQLERIFDLFVQLPHSGAATEGLGIGLALVRQLVSLHGGTVSATSDGPGMGSTFCVRLPASVPDGSGPASSHQAPTSDVARALRILVVDDNRDAADSLATVLQLMGHVATTAHSATEALEVIERQLPELIFADIGLPDMSGYDLSEAIRRLPHLRGVTLVALTGWGSDDDRRRAVAAGFDYHLAKPAEMAVIERIIARTLLELR